MKFLSLIGCCGLLAICMVNALSTQAPFENKREQIVWSDEFSFDGLPDSSKWSYDIGDGCKLPCGCGWGNKEKQYYRAANLKNARVEDGHLIIEAHQEDFEGSNYTSARLITKKKGDWKYGRIDIRAKVPSGRGTWPAIWMLPTKSKYGHWPKSGEIDILEHVGYLPDSTFGTIHTQKYNGMIGTQQSGRVFSPTAESEFHVYSIRWDKDAIRWYLDDQLYYTFSNEQKTFEYWPFDQEFHLILNVAVGGYWGGKYGIDDAIWPQKMMVDYVRVFKEEV